MYCACTYHVIVQTDSTGTYGTVHVHDMTLRSRYGTAYVRYRSTGYMYVQYTYMPYIYANEHCTVHVHVCTISYMYMYTYSRTKLSIDNCSFQDKCKDKVRTSAAPVVVEAYRYLSFNIRACIGSSIDRSEACASFILFVMKPAHLFVP